MDAADRARSALEARQAGRVEHPGGDLLSHLVRTQALLESWGARPALALAGLCHAAYGTQGLPVQLFGLDERERLAELVGTEAEAIVYGYGSCDRDYVHPQLGREVVAFRDRFSDVVNDLSGQGLLDFVELTFANELDLVGYSPAFAAANGSGIAAVLRPCRAMVTDAAWASFDLLLVSPGAAVD